jgi:hypothetical protein
MYLDYLKTLGIDEKEVSNLLNSSMRLFKPGGMMMPILVEITYEDGTVENFKYLKSGEK